MYQDFLMRIAERLDLVTGLNVAKKDPASVLRPYDTFESEMFQARKEFAMLKLDFKRRDVGPAAKKEITPTTG